MGTEYTRQSTYTDGDTITAAHTNDEFDRLLAVFEAGTGHTHDGTANEGGPISKLLSNGLTFGSGADSDITIAFDTSGSDGELKWMHDDDRFQFSDDIMIVDNEQLIFGTNSDVAISYDETTTDSLKIAATEGAGLAITLMADEGDDAGDEWKLNIADGGTLTLGNDIASAGSYVTHLTIVPHATVASSTATFAGNLTVGGNLSITGTSSLSLGAESVDSDAYVDGSIDTAHIANLQITTALIAADAVTGAKIADDAIDSEHYTDGSIDNAHLADDAVGADELASDAVVTASIVDANVTLAKIANQAANTVLVRDANSSGVVSAKALTTTQILIGDGTGFTAAALGGDVTMTNAGVVTIGAGAVENSMLADDAVGADELASDAVVTASIADGNVTTAKIAADAITTAKIAADAITGAEIADDAIDSEHYTNASIDLAHMSANSIDSDQYVDGSIDTAHIANLQITTGLIAADAITAAKIADDAIDSEHYADGSIDEAHLADNAITLAKMASGTDGNIISYDASGNPVAIATGTDGQVLTSTGAGSPPAFEDASGGSMELVTKVTTEATDLTALVIPIPETTDFEYLKLIINLKAETASDAYWNMLCRNTADDTFDTGSTDYRYMQAYGYGTSTGSVGGGHDVNGSAFIRFVNGFPGDGSDDFETFHLVLYMYHTVGTDKFPRFSWNTGLEKANSSSYTYFAAGGAAMCSTAIGIDEIKFLKDDGAEFTNQGYTLYKVKK